MSDPNQPPVQKGRGCFFWGCLTCSVLFVVFCLAMFGVYYVAKSQVAKYTDSAPAKLPQVEMSDEQYKQLQDRVKSFGDAVKDGKEAEPLTLDERDLNALMLRDPQRHGLSNHVYVSLKGDQVRAQVSFPLPDVPLVRGRYFNGEAGFKVSLTNGVLFVDPQEIQVKGNPVSGRLKSDIQSKMRELTDQAARDERKSKEFEKLESIEIRDSKVIVRPRPPAAPKN